MKKLVITAVILIGLSSANRTLANDLIHRANIAETELKLKALNGVKFKVTAFNILEKSVLRIQDKKGEVLFKGIVENGNYEKVFNLSLLPDGDYSFVLSTGKEVSKKAFSIKTETKRTIVEVAK